MKDRLIISLFVPGAAHDPNEQSPFKALGKPAYSAKEVLELLSHYNDRDPVHDLLNATHNFLAATALNTERFNFADMRNSNPEINTNVCHDKLQTMGKALQAAKTTLQQSPLTQKQLNEGIQYCERAIHTRLTVLPQNDKFKAAYDRENLLKSILTPAEGLRSTRDRS